MNDNNFVALLVMGAAVIGLLFGLGLGSEGAENATVAEERAPVNHGDLSKPANVVTRVETVTVEVVPPITGMLATMCSPENLKKNADNLGRHASASSINNGAALAVEMCKEAMKLYNTDGSIRTVRDR